MSISFKEQAGVFSLQTANTEYQLKIGEVGVLMHTYYGQRVDGEDMSYLYQPVDRGFSGNPYEKQDSRGCSLDLMPQEYSGNGVGDYRPSAISVRANNGATGVDLRYKAHRITGGKYTFTGLPYVRDAGSKVDTLIVTLEDRTTALEVDLYYGVFEDKDIITRHTVVRNCSSQGIDITRAASMCMDVLHSDMDLIHFHGKHVGERQPERLPVSSDIHRIASKRGMSSHHENPFVILCDKTTTEEHGTAYGCMLMYSGNHFAEIERDQAGSVRLVMGINDIDFCWKLGSGEQFETPETILAYSDAGLNELSYLYHRIIRENVVPERFMNMKRPVLINNWEATYFDFDADKIMAIADQAADLGVEMFVLDDGWFGNRNDDKAGLGDWYVNEKKLVGGLKPIVDHINSRGMKFGLWFEPEMINENTDLYKEHPDWALKEPGRQPNMSRSQMVLDMSRPEVVDYIFNSMCKVLDSANIEYIKWDFNRSLSNVYSAGLRYEQQGEVAHRFIMGTYSLYEKLTSRYPGLMIEGCSGGGGRFDAGILFYSPQIWCSDNTDAINRLAIQRGTSYGYPVSAMGSHVSAVPNHQTGRTTPLDTRATVAMSGTFGYELDLGRLSEDEKQAVKAQIKEFNERYWLIQKGRYYRLTPGYKSRFYEAWEFAAEDRTEAMVCIVATDVIANQEFAHVKLYGLDDKATYKVTITGATEEKTIDKTGCALMAGGLALPVLFGDYPSIKVYLKRL